MKRLILVLLAAASGVAAADPAVVYLSERAACPSTALMETALRDHLSRHDVSAAPTEGGVPIAVIDLGDRYRVIVNGVVRDFSDPARDCVERAAEATVFVALTLEPPVPFAPPTVYETPPASVAAPSPVAPPFVVPQPTATSKGLPPPHRLELQVVVGTAVGVAGSETADTAYQVDPATSRYRRVSVGSGAMVEPLHVAVTVGWRHYHWLSTSLQLRLGFPVADPTADSTSDPSLGSGHRASPVDFAVLLRDRFIFGSGRLHPFLTAGIGVGWLNHLIDVSRAQSSALPLVDQTTADRYGTGPNPVVNRVCPTSGPCYDTTTMGYFFIAASVGALIDLKSSGSRTTALVLEAEMEAAPWQLVGVSFDFHVGFETQSF